MSRSAIARTLNVPRSRFYQRKPTRQSVAVNEVSADRNVVTAIKRQLELQPRYTFYGYRRWRAVLRQREGLVVNHKRLRRLLRQLGLSQDRLCRVKRNGSRKHVDWKPAEPNRVWQMDMTKVYVDGTGWLHHIAIIDLFDRSIVGHHESFRARAKEWQAAWDNALLNRFPNGPRGTKLVLQVAGGCQPYITQLP